MILIILAVIAVALIITHTDASGAWVAWNLMSETRSNLKQILEQETRHEISFKRTG